MKRALSYCIQGCPQLKANGYCELYKKKVTIEKDAGPKRIYACYLTGLQQTNVSVENNIMGVLEKLFQSKHILNSVDEDEPAMKESFDQQRELIKNLTDSIKIYNDIRTLPQGMLYAEIEDANVVEEPSTDTSKIEE